MRLLRLTLCLFVAIAAFSLICLVPAQAQNIVHLRVVTSPGELTETEIAEFESANPDIELEIIDWFSFSYADALALGEVPDVLRVQANQMPQFVRDGLLLDLTPYFEASSLIHTEDLANAADYYLFDNHYYGLPKDWSLDLSLYVYNPAFEAAGIPIPSTTEPLSYAELAELAQALTLTEADNGIQYGYSSPLLERAISGILTQLGTAMFNSDFSEMELSDNPEALEVIRYFYELGLQETMPSDYLSSSQWDAIVSGHSAIFQYGYWFGAIPDEDSPLYENLTMLPAPTWDKSLPRLNTTVGPVGMAILVSSQHPDEAYRFFEWYIAGESAANRAKTGWGAPILLSMFDLLPYESSFDQQRLDLLQSELPYSDWTLPVYPYDSINTTFYESWTQNMLLAQAGEIDFEIFVSNLQDSVNLAILDEQIP